MASHQSELSNLTTEELKELCNATSDDKYNELANESDEVKSLENRREMFMAEVRSLAEFNLSRQSDYESDRAKLLVSVADSNKLKEDIQEKAAKLLELSKKTSLDSTLAILLGAASKAEDESEKIAKEFLDNSIEYEEFLTKYRDRRTLAHLRRIKAERLRLETKESWTGIRTQSFGHLSL